MAERERGRIEWKTKPVSVKLGYWVLGTVPVIAAVLGKFASSVELNVLGLVVIGLAVAGIALGQRVLGKS